MSGATDVSSETATDPTATGNAEYDALPESIKAMYTLTEYLWLGEGRVNLIQVETEPEF